MRAIAGICVGLVLLASVVVTDKVCGDESDRAAAKQILSASVKLLEPRIKDDKDALAGLMKLKDPSEKELDRMANEIKTTFKVANLNPDGVRKVTAEVKKTIEKAEPNDLKTLLKNRDVKAVPFLCWLFGCP